MRNDRNDPDKLFPNSAAAEDVSIVPVKRWPFIDIHPGIGYFLNEEEFLTARRYRQ